MKITVILLKIQESMIIYVMINRQIYMWFAEMKLTVIIVFYLIKNLKLS